MTKSLTDVLGEPRKPLKIDRLLGRIEGEDREQIEAALRDPDIPAGRVAKAFGHVGYPVHYHTVQVWRDRNGVS